METPDRSAGVRYLLEAGRLLANDRTLWPFVTAPLLVNLAVGGLLTLVFGGLLMLLVGPVILHVVTTRPLDGLKMVTGVGFCLAWLAGIFVSKVAVVLGAPWYQRLAVEVERRRLPAAALAGATAPAPAIADVARAFGTETKKQLAIIFLSVPAAPLGATLGAAYVAILQVLAVGLDHLDPSLRRRVPGLGARIRFLGRRPREVGGFALAAAVLVGLPVLNLLTVPICTVAGALLYCDRLHAHAAPVRAPKRRPRPPQAA